MGEFDGFKEIYDELDETGKEKLSSLLKKIRSEKMIREEEINMWSILIAVLKNRDRGWNYDIEHLVDDISIVKNMIKKF